LRHLGGTVRGGVVYDNDFPRKMGRHFLLGKMPEGFRKPLGAVIGAKDD
jgi:hypothetical protein